MTDRLIDQTGERFAICHEWLLYHPRLSSNAKCVYLVLKRHAREKTTCFPGQKGICDKLKLTRRTVYDCLQDLQTENLIKIEYSTAGKHKTKSTYTLLLVNGQNLPLQNIIEGAKFTHTHEQNLPTKDKQLKDNTPPGATAPADSSTSNAKEFTAWFVNEYAKRNPGKKYFFQGGKDGSAVKRLLSHYDIYELKALLICGWNTPDRNGFSTRTVCMTIAGFSSMVNQISAANHKSVKAKFEPGKSTGQLALQAKWKKDQEEEERLKNVGKS